MFFFFFFEERQVRENSVPFCDPAVSATSQHMICYASNVLSRLQDSTYGNAPGATLLCQLEIESGISECLSCLPRTLKSKKKKEKERKKSPIIGGGGKCNLLEWKSDSSHQQKQSMLATHGIGRTKLSGSYPWARIKGGKRLSSMK